MTPKLLTLNMLDTNTIPDQKTMDRLAQLGLGLLTLEILYRMPDYRNVLNTFSWQFYDVDPHFPRMHQFLDFWKKEIDGPLHTVRFTHHKNLKTGQIMVQHHIMTM